LELRWIEIFACPSMAQFIYDMFGLSFVGQVNRVKV
jgi:hypothetical protein